MNGVTTSSTATRNSSSTATFILAAIAAFGTYFCMYGFRKPFAVAQYDGITVGAWQFKSLAVSSQVIGYMLSKWLSIKYNSESHYQKRATTIIVLILLAEASLVMFGFVPIAWKPLAIFLNGLPLGMVFGLVLGFLEGRRQTEALAAILCLSFILADGFTKSCGKFLLDMGVDQFWMPAATGLLFLAPLLLFVWLLKRIQAPSVQDRAERLARLPMDSRDRKAYFRNHAIVLVPILLMFVLVTMLRTLRSDFAPEIWQALGVQTSPSIFATTEFWVGIVVTLATGGTSLIRNSKAAYRVSLATCVCGLLMLLMATFAEQTSRLSAFWFIVIVGIGVYLPYVAVHTTLLERYIAQSSDRANLVYLMSLADFLGYFAYVILMLIQGWILATVTILSLFRIGCYGAALISLLALGFEVRKKAYELVRL